MIGILQLYSKGIEDETITNRPNITFFKYSYVANGLFYKDDYVLENIQIKWNDNYFFKIQKDIEYIGPMWLKVTIPYFQILEKISTTVSTTTNDSNLNEIIYDNHDTFLVIINSIYYLIPIIFLTSPNIKYYFSEIKFIDIKQYFNNIAEINILGDTFIHMLSFTPSEYSNHIIPLLLSQGHEYDKLALNIILNDKFYRKNLLTQNSFDLYISNYIEDKLITHYIDINKYDMYEYKMNQEVYYYYIFYLNGIYINQPPINLDLIRAYEYCNLNNITTVDTFLKETITTNSLILQFMLQAINPAIDIIYNFYKKVSVINYPVSYNFVLLQSDIIDFNTTGASNLINEYYPLYHIDITLINNRLPFTLTTGMTLTTLSGEDILYTVEGTTHILTINDTSTINLLTLSIVIGTNNNTENIIDISVSNTDTNLNTEWNTNLIKSLYNLNYNNNIMNYLFSDFKKNYYLKEDIIKMNFNFINQNNNLQNLWIELKTIMNQYNKKNSIIGFNKTDTFQINKNLIETDYKNYNDIQTDPQDLTNVYAICMNNFILALQDKYFNNDMFLLFFYNKINSYIYQRYIRIVEEIYRSYLSDTTIISFTGLLFYYNIVLKEYITKEQIKNYLKELFNITSMICYINLSMTPLTLVSKDILDYTTPSNDFSFNPSCFHELKIENKYDISSGKFIININSIQIYQTFTTCKYVLQIDERYIDIIDYTTVGDYIIFNINIPTYTLLYLHETYISSIPYINISENSVLNDITTVVAYDKQNAINLFEEYNVVNILFNTNSIIIISYQRGNNTDIVVASYDIDTRKLISDNLDKNYLIHDKIEVTIINLQRTYLTITDDDCMNIISSTYPYIELNKTSDVYSDNISLFSSRNTIKSNDTDIKIISETTDVIVLYCYGSVNASSIDINIMANYYLPNMYNYTSLNSNINSCMDYMIQKPFIIQLYNSINSPVYCIANIPKGENIYIDNQIVYTIYQLTGDQLIRDTDNLYASHYYPGLLKNKNNIDTIETTILAIYNSVYTGIYNDIINIIESSQTSYFSIYNEIITDINKTDKYGITITNLYHSILPLNSMKYISGLSSYTMSPTNYSLTDYDVYTNLAISIYNFTNINGQKILSDTKMIAYLSNQFTTMQTQIINSPWQSYNSSFKLSSVVLSMLSNYSLYGERILKQIDDNQSIFLITNHSNYPQDFTNEYKIRGKYLELAYNIERTNIELLYPNPWSNILQNTPNDDIWVSWSKDNKKVNVDNNGLYYTAGSTFEDSPLYKTEKLNPIDTFSLIGAIQIKNKMIQLNSTYKITSKYIVIDNNCIVDTSATNFKYQGINYKSKGLILELEYSIYSFNNIKPVYYYQIEQSNLDTFNINDNYLVYINNSHGYMKYTGTYLVLLLNNNIIIGQNNKLFYTTTDETDSVIFEYIGGTTLSNIVYSNIFIFTNSTITITGIYNYYNDTDNWLHSNFIIFENDIFVTQYSDYINILGLTLLQYNGNTDITIRVYDTTSYDLPPLYIDQYNISVFNPLGDINWIEYKDDWICIDTLLCQVKNLETTLQNINTDGNYLLYHGKTKPILLNHPDIFYDMYTDTDTIYNPYNNSYTTSLTSSTDYLANNNIITSVDNGVYLFPQNKNIQTILILQDPETMILYNRPLIITNTPTLEYSLYQNATLVDSYIVITPDNVSSSPILVRTIVFANNVTISTSSSFIQIEYTSPDYNINVINSDTITQGMNHMITINVDTDIIILWLYIGEKSFYIQSNTMIKEPHYIDISSQQTITSDMTIYSCDPSYFIQGETIQTHVGISGSVVFKSNKMLNFEEITSNSNSITSVVKNIHNLMTWVYIGDIDINIKYTYYIFVNNNLYYNYKNNRNELEYDIPITSGDMYVYPYEPMFIKCTLACSIDHETIYLYTDSKLQRNQIIKIGDLVIIVNEFSFYYNSYIGTIISPVGLVPNIIIGYYSMGIWSNFYEKNRLFNNNKISNLLYGTTASLNFGDYYMDTNIFKNYNGESKSDFIFKFNSGVYIELYKINNKWYYDSLIYTIEPNMVLYYDNILLIVDIQSIDNITFKNDNIEATYIEAYLPIQPFITSNVIIENNIIMNMDNFTGWIEINDENVLSLYKVSNLVITGLVINDNITARLFNTDISIECDFSNYYNLSTDQMAASSNYKIPMSIICNSNVETNVYFTQTSSTNYDFTNLKYYYNQYILVNSNHYRLINITPSRIYIDAVSMDEQTCQLIFSASSITCDIFISNNHIINNSYRLDYPIINNSIKSNIIALLSAEADSDNNISQVIDDVEIYYSVIKSEKMTSLLNNQLTANFFYENYIPITVTYNTIINFEQQRLSFDNRTNVLLQEVTKDNNVYQHYITFIVKNYNFYITSNNNFHSNTSNFYLYNIISVIITKNNNIILNDDCQIYKPVNLISRNTIISTVNIKTNTNGKPIRTTDKWKYLINFDSVKFNMINIFNRVLYYGNNIPCSIIFDSNYYIESSVLIETLSYVYFNETQFINKMIVIKTLKDGYTLTQPVFNYISNEIIEPIKLVNRAYIHDNIYNYTINIANTIVPIIGINYLGDNNLITAISIVDDKYQVSTEYKLTDVVNDTLYNTCTSYIDNSSYIIKQPEISTSLPALTSYLKIITFKYISYGIKPWKEWSLITTRYNDNLEVYLNKNNIVYDGSIFTFQASTPYTSYFTLKETETLKTTILSFYQNNILQTYKLDIMNDLYKLELYLMNEITLYLSQEYFWQNTNYILKQIIENYNGVYKWTLYNNNVMIIQDNILEIDLYPSNFIITDSTKRTNYIFSEFDIVVNNNTITISRNPIIIDNIFTSIITDITENLMYGITIDSAISSIINMGIQKNNMISTLPINYQYMDSLVYYISKMYSDIVKNETNKLNILTNIDRSVQNYSTGKYNDYLFNTKYFSLLSQTTYMELPTPSINTIYIDPYMKGKLNIYSTSENLINIISTNNIFSYNLTFTYGSPQDLLTENIKSKNTYTVNVLDNYQHLDDIVITDKIVNTDSLSFHSNKIIEPIDVMVKVNEEYNITNKKIYGFIYNITIDNSITGDEDLYYNDNTILYISVMDNIYKVALPLIDLTHSDLIKVMLRIAIKNYKVINNKTYLTISDNITTDYNYIVINDIIYSLFNDNGYYIDMSQGYNERSNVLIQATKQSNITSLSNLTYALKFITITSSINTDILIADISLDHGINPQEYNIKDPLLKPNFAIDNVIIKQVNILTDTTLQLQYTGMLSSIITHSYNMMQSIPYRINTITHQNKFFYKLNNINSISITDNIRIYNNNESYNATIYSIVNNVVMFNISHLILINDLNEMYVDITKSYNLKIITTDNNTIYTDMPSTFNMNQYDYIYTIVVDEIKYTVTLDIINNMIAIPLVPFISTNIILEQLLILNTNSIMDMEYNTLYIVDTVNDSSVLNASNIYIPVIQTLDSNMNEFDSKYYYKISNMASLLAYTTVYIIDSNNYIEGNIIMIQTDYIIIGTNILIDAKIVKIYTDDFKYSVETYLAFTSYIYQKGQLLEQINPNIYYVLFNNNSLENYNISNNITNNTVIISFKYSNIEVINNSYSYVGFNKVPDKTSISLIETTKYSDVEWINNIALHLFNSIQLTIDENIIEKLDYDIYTIYTNYIINMWRRDEFNKMTKPRLQGKDMIFFLPLTFRFTLEPSSYLPISKMNRSNIKLKFNLCKMNSLILNLKTNITKQVYPIIDIHYDYIITNKYKPKSEYILYKCLYSYQNFILNNIQENNHINLYNRTIDLFLITTKDTKNTYETTHKLMDIWYQEYLANNIIDFRIFELIDSEINIKSKRYTLLLNHPVIKNTRYAMYLDEKNLQYINENLNDSDLKYSKKLTILSLYFTYNFINKDIVSNTDIINSINIYIDGNELLPNLPGSYLNNTIPYLKGYVLPDGYYMYSFALDSLASQPNGMLNLKYIKDLQINSTQNISNKEIKLKICTSEYRILRIENNVCKLI